MNDMNRDFGNAITSKFGVQTAAGFIPHLRHPDGFDMPVKLAFEYAGGGMRINPNKYHRPLRTADGELIYALPGGGSYTELKGEL